MKKAERPFLLTEINYICSIKKDFAMKGKS